MRGKAGGKDRTPRADNAPRDVRSDYTAEESFARLTDLTRRIAAVPHKAIEKAEKRRKKRK